MKVTRVKGLSRPYVENDTLYLPYVQHDIRWNTIVTESAIVVIRLEWGSASPVGWVTEWVFFNSEQEISWDEVQDKVSVVRPFRDWNFHPDDVIPWGDDIETLVALERI